MKTEEVVKILEENKIIEGWFKDKKSAKEKRNEFNKPIMEKYTKTNKPKKDSLPLYIVVKGKDHMHYDNWL